MQITGFDYKHFHDLKYLSSIVKHCNIMRSKFIRQPRTPKKDIVRCALKNCGKLIRLIFNNKNQFQKYIHHAKGEKE